MDIEGGDVGDGLQDFDIHVLENAGTFLLPFVYASTASLDARTFYKLDRTLDAMLTNEVGQKASISQGSALMRVAASVFTEIPSLKAMRDKFLSDGSICFHHAPTFGLLCGLIGINSETSQRAFLFITLRDIISATTSCSTGFLISLKLFFTGGFTEESTRRARPFLCSTPCRDATDTCFPGCSVLEFPFAAHSVMFDSL